MSNPFFSVGITTYRRHEELKMAIHSILAQTFADFEVLVGNDYQGEVLTSEVLDLSDPRIKILNFPVNLREVGNMNALIGASRGRYFTLLADDDYCSPHFLNSLYLALSQKHDTKVAFTSYKITEGYEPLDKTKQPQLQENLATYSGGDFVTKVFSKQILAMSLCGAYDINFLRSLGGVEPVIESAPVGLYAEYLLLAKLTQLDSVNYVNFPLTYYRAHNDSWGVSNQDVALYAEAGPLLISKSLEYFTAHPPTLLKNLSNQIEMVASNYFIKYWAHNGDIAFSAINSFFRRLGKLHGGAIFQVLIISKHIKFTLKYSLKKAIPGWLLHKIKTVF